ncbi:hypothetical protein Q5P01_020160 [Channa striata]|uniref:Uncharacterized protein n=1 Tax=Channa striata TaxID=64152 RepID=A0AA88LX15_CHASR|nr:hypothetical protein Q5P01_020160 [Channa striata]
MKAISPVRSVRSCYKAVCCISEQSLAISRNKHPSRWRRRTRPLRRWFCQSRLQTSLAISQKKKVGCASRKDQSLVQGNTCLHFTPGKRTRGAERVG